MERPRARQGKLLLLVKWNGYEDPTDRTWEPEANLLFVLLGVLLTHSLPLC